MPSNQSQAGFGRPEGTTVQNAVDEQMDDILPRLRGGKLQLDSYGTVERRAITYTLGTNPIQTITLIVDGPDDDDAIVWGGYYEYSDGSGSAAVPFGQRDAQELFDLLNADRPNLDEGQLVDSDSEHSDGDGCAIYVAGYQVHVNGDTERMTSVENLEVDDTYQDPAYELPNEWLTVYDVWVSDDQDVHVDSQGRDE